MTSATLNLSSAGRSKPAIPNAQLGMLLFVATELMYFMALISAYLVTKATSGIRWVPPADVTLPVAATGVNTMILLSSGVFFYLCGRAFDQRESTKVGGYLASAILLGCCFVAIQGFEWSQLLARGMDLNSGIFAACFYLLIGSHAAHAFGAVFAMLFIYRRFKKGLLTRDQLQSMQIFWFFVVGVWPVLYGLVYF